VKTYLEEYKSKLITVDDAAKMVKSDQLVHYGEFAMTSPYFDEALAKRTEELTNVTVRTCSCLFPPQIILADPEGKHFALHDSFFSPVTRYLADHNFAVYYLPTIYSEIIDYYKSGTISVDLSVIRVGPMDKHGYFNYGPSNSGTSDVASLSKILIVEINDKAPRCLGGKMESIHISDVDFIIEGPNTPLVQLPEVTANEAEIAIANLVMAQIEDGACLQLGIGGMPNTIGKLIADSDLKDLGVHTEMLNDSMVDMFEAGRITGKRKNIDQRKMVYTFAMGSNRLYEFLDNNPACASYPCDYTNDANIISLNDKVVTVNSCVEADLFGQINSESMGTRQISGTGGQLDFLMAGYKSKGGKSFLCMTSTKANKKGELQSRIQPTISPGSSVSIHRGLVNYLVTEYGIVKLKGLSTWQRAEAMISIAHPQFRDNLVKSAQETGIWRKSNRIT